MLNWTFHFIISATTFKFQEVGTSIISAQSGVAYGERATSNAQTQSLGADQSFSEAPSLNLTGVKLVMQSEAKEPLFSEEMEQISSVCMSGRI